MARTRLSDGRLKGASFSSRYSDVPYGDQAALVKALRNQQIAGAGLDTFDMEPLPDEDELRELPNVLLTPHLGYTVRELMQAFYEDTVENLTAYLNGSPIRILT